MIGRIAWFFAIALLLGVVAASHRTSSPGVGLPIAQDKALGAVIESTGDALDGLLVLPVRDSTITLAPPEDPNIIAPVNNRPDLGLGNVGGFNFDEPLLRVNPLNGQNVVITSHQGMVISTDGGDSFNGPFNYPNTLGPNGGDTGMTFDSQGRLFWSTLMTVGGNRPFQVLQANPVTGAVIQGPVDVIASSGDPNPGSEDKEYIVADEYPGSPNTDNLYAIWTKLSGNWQVLVTRSTDAGVNWSTPLQLSSDMADVQPWPSDIAVAPNGDVYATYHSGGATGSTGFTPVMRSTDGGVSFPQVSTAFTAGQSDVSPNVVGQPGAIPGLQFWMLGSGQPWVHPDPARPGNVYVVSNDDPDNNHGNGDDGDVVFARSTDNGQNWVVSTIPDGSGGAHQIFPFSAIDEFGNIAVAWFDTRSGATNSFGRSLLDIWATFSMDGGITWAPAFQINDLNNPIDPDFPNNQRRFPTPQQTPCAKTQMTNNETCRIGEYFGIDIHRGTAHLTWIGNTFDGGGAVTGDQLWYDRFSLPTDLEVDKVAQQTDVVAGNAVTYTVSVTNNGSVDAFNVILTDNMSPLLQFDSSTASCTETSPGTVVCDLGTLTPGQQVEFEITVVVSPNATPGIYINNATATMENPDTDDTNDSNSAGITVSRVVDIEMSIIESSDPVVAGIHDRNLRYNVQATNKGPSAVTDLVVSTVLGLPANVIVDEFDPLGGSWDGNSNQWTVSIGAGGSSFLNVWVTVPLEADESDVVSIEASVLGSGGGETIINPEDDTATETTSIRWPTANWTVSKNYVDDDGGSADVRLECSEGSGLAFGDPDMGVTDTTLSWRRFDIGSTTCSVVETPPNGYYEVDRTADCDVSPVADIDDGGDYDCAITNAVTDVRVKVTKEFTDGDHATPVTVEFLCNKGTELFQDFVIMEGPAGVTFSNFRFTDGDTDCWVRERTDLLPGYTPTYTGGIDQLQQGDAVGVFNEPEGCVFTGITGGADLTCQVSNEADPQPVLITKTWEFAGSAQPSDIDPRFQLSLYCEDNLVKVFSGELDQEFKAMVVPAYPQTECYVTEKMFVDYVEVDNGCGKLVVKAGQGAACEIVNTVFFEGIPSTGRLGKLLLVLLMLTMGGLAVRRLA